MNKEEFIKLMEFYNQKEIIQHFLSLGEDRQREFLEKTSKLNIKKTFSLYDELVKKEKEKIKFKEILPPENILKPEENLEYTEYLKNKGEKKLKEGKIAVCIVAGGQGTRLGFPYPKGMFPVSPVKNKTLFQIFTEKVKKLSEIYNVSIPLLFMVNPESKELIEKFFSDNNFFGYKENIIFFTQEILPSITPDGKLILKDETTLFANPDGHGGCLKALYKQGIVEKLKKEGKTDIFYCHIDNPLVNVCDPVFLGYHIENESEFSLKVVKKIDPEEKVGMFVKADGKKRIIEYIEFPEELKKKKDENGNLIFNAGSIGIHYISIDFIEKLNKNNFPLSYHKAKKKIKSIYGEIEGIKFEMFIFDAIPLAKNVSCVETKREDEFAPLKNKKGQYSPEEVKEAISNLCKKYLKKAGINLPEEKVVEISPLYPVDIEELKKKLKKINPTSEKIYISLFTPRS